MEKSFALAQGWGQLVLALQRRRSFVHIGFAPQGGADISSRIARRLIPTTERAWLWLSRWRHPRALVHFPWADAEVNRQAPDRRTIVTLHQPYEKWAPGTIDWCRKLGGVHTLTEREADYLRTRAPDLLVRCVLHGIDIDFWRPAALPPLDKKRVVFAGRYMRNIPMFLRVMRRLLAERPEVEVEMLLHREFQFSPDCLPLPPGIKTVGPFSVEELRDFFQQASLVFMPYDNVTASNSVCEALGCGTPFFTSRVGGMESYAKGGMVLFENNDDEAALAAVTRCLDDPAWRAELSAAARAAAVRHLDWNLIAAQIDDFYAEVASRAGSAK